MTTFLKEDLLFRGDVQYKVIRPVGQQIQLENIVTGELSLHDPQALLDDYTRGLLYTVPIGKHVPPPSKAQKGADLGVLKDIAREETRRRVDYIVKLNEQGAFGKSKKDLRAAILEISRFRGEPRPPHHTTVYRWRKRFIKAHEDVRSLFSRLEMRGGRNKTRLAHVVEAIIDEKIESVFLSNKRGSAEDVYDAIFLAIQHANTTRIESEWLKVPGLRTIQRRISRLYAFDRAVAKLGNKEASRRYGVYLTARKVSRILQLVEIDHTPVDLMVVNEDRVVIGRPTITVVLDRFSRCILGFHLSLAGHGTPAVFEALRHALMPKTYIAHRYPDLTLDWPCYGWFEKLLMDNGREFHSDAVVDALLNLGIVSEYAASREPNDKPFVERFLRTFNYSFIHKLPGTTLAKVHQRVGFKAEKGACITLEELDKLIHAWIGVYLNRSHAGLCGKTPLQVWIESAQAYPPRLKANASDVDIEFSEVTNSALQHYGIDLNTFRYASERLVHLRRLLPENARVQVKWPRNDVGHIWVWDPFQNEYFKVENVDSTLAGLTLEQAKVARKKIKEDPDLRRTRAETKEVVRDITKTAEKDKDLKQRRKAARFANQTSQDLHRKPQPKVAEEQVATSEVCGNDDFDEVEMDFSNPNGEV